MVGRSVLVELPVDVYEQIKRAAELSHRSVEDVLVEAVMAAAPVIDTAPEALRSSLAHLAYLNDAALWQAARATIPAKQRERLEFLHVIQQQRLLTDDEIAEETNLLRLYQETLLVRAQAAVLLKQRGYDVADPSQFAPLG